MIDVVHIAVCMKPTEGNFAQNALEHGVSGLNMDACRIDGKTRIYSPFKAAGNKTVEYKPPEGRFPTNVILDGSNEVTELFPESSSNYSAQNAEKYADKGSASRFFKECEPDD